MPRRPETSALVHLCPAQGPDAFDCVGHGGALTGAAIPYLLAFQVINDWQPPRACLADNGVRDGKSNLHDRVFLLLTYRQFGADEQSQLDSPQALCCCVYRGRARSLRLLFPQ